jgi:hypothetical protein
VRVPLRGARVFVPEHFADHKQIYTMVHHLRRRAVPKVVKSDIKARTVVPNMA